MEKMLRRGRKGVSLVTLLYFVAFVVVPLMVLALGVGRYLHVRNVLSVAADAAALAAAQDVDMDYYRLTGEIRFAGYAHDEAWIYAMQNAEWLVRRKAYPRIVEIRASAARRVVEVTVGADCGDLFGGVGPVWIQVRGEAEVAPLHTAYPVSPQ